LKPQATWKSTNAMPFGRTIFCYGALAIGYWAVSGSYPAAAPPCCAKPFPLLPKSGLPHEDGVWESSRFALDIHSDASKAAAGLAAPTYELFAGMIEFGLARGLTKILTVTDVRMERILRRATWPLERVAPPQAIGVTMAVAGHLEVSFEALLRLRKAGGFSAPVLWTPVLSRAA
jgi:acyl homoserine lactone synthase